MKELEEKKEKEARLKKVLESQSRRIQRKEELEEMRKFSIDRVKDIKKKQGGKYMHDVLEDKYQHEVVLPEIAR